jgi:ABC-type branched-subunit amino acid transport system permease subunit
MAMVGGLGLGVLQAELAGFLPTDNVLTNNLRPALPFIALFLLLVGRLVTARIRHRDAAFEREISDPLSGVDPPPPPLAETLRPHWMTILTRVVGVVAAAVTFILVWWVFGATWQGLFVAGVCLGVIMLSMVVMTGIGGTISLCQATFAAIGAFTTAQLADRWDVPVLAGMVIGALIAALIGAILAIPVIRLPAVYAALATLAFALMFETIIRPIEAISGGAVPVSVPRPLIGSIDFNDDRYFFLLASVICALVGIAVILVRQGTTGRFLDAIRGSETAARSVGISPGRQRLVAFIVSAGIAGLGGGLLASFAGQASYEANFVFFYGLVWLTLVVSSGSRSVQAAVTGGFAFFAVPKLLEQLFTWPTNFLASHPDVSGIWRSILEFPNPTWGQGVAFILFGFGALTYAKHPEGIIEFQTSRSIQRTLDRVERRRTKRGGGPGADLTASHGSGSSNGSGSSATPSDLESARG